MNGTPIAWPLRVWLVVELFFAVSATISVALHPGQTGANFAWPIKPEVMAALIGSFYAALVPVLVLVIFAMRWEMVRVFVIPGLLFTFAQLVVTFLHWDRFAVWTAPFNIWFASYLLPPPVFLACYVWQQRRAAVISFDSPLARWERVGLIVLGGLFTLEAAVGLVLPVWFLVSMPWLVTPLNGRALGGYLLLLGLMMLSMARENDRDRVRIVAPFLVLLLPVIAFQVSRFPEQVYWDHLRIKVSLVLLTAVALLGISLMRGNWRRSLG